MRTARHLWSVLVVLSSTAGCAPPPEPDDAVSSVEQGLVTSVQHVDATPFIDNERLRVYSPGGQQIATHHAYPLGNGTARAVYKFGGVEKPPVTLSFQTLAGHGVRTTFQSSSGTAKLTWFPGQNKATFQSLTGHPVVLSDAEATQLSNTGAKLSPDIGCVAALGTAMTECVPCYESEGSEAAKCIKCGAALFKLAECGWDVLEGIDDWWIRINCYSGSVQQWCDGFFPGDCYIGGIYYRNCDPGGGGGGGGGGGQGDRCDGPGQCADGFFCDASNTCLRL